MSTAVYAPRVTRSAFAARPASSVRLTRRGRLVVFAAGLLMVLLFGIWLAAGSTATDEAGKTQVEVITVAPGETLWGIAAEVADGGDVGAMVAEIREMNDLDTSMVYAGQDLRVPTD